MSETSPPRLPWAATGTALVAFAALAVTERGGTALPILGLMLLAAHATPVRLGTRARWVARSVLFAVVAGLAAVAPGTRGEGDGLLNPRLLGLVGVLCAAELVVRVWRRYDAEEANAKMLLAVIGCSAVVFLAAVNTFEGTYVRWFAPVYIFFVALALRGYRRRAVRAKGEKRARLASGLLRGTAVALALTLGGGAYSAFYVYRGELTDWGSRLLGERLWREAVGMSASPRLGPTFNLRGSPVRVLRLEGYSGDGHLRGLSFDIYDGGRWGPGLRLRRFKNVPVGELRPDAPGPRARVNPLRNEGPGLLFAPLHAAGLVFEEGVAVEWARSDGGPLRGSGPPLDTYTIIGPGDDAGSAGPLAAPPDADERARCLAVPGSMDKRVWALAERIAGRLRDPRARVAAVEAYLIGHHSYSLSTNPGPGDPVSNFLLQRKSAHCEFFASAAAILLRCVGVPTRYVTGYLAHESAGPSVLVVRQRDAHAWAESWIEGQGWMTVEATPGDGRPDENEEPIPLWRRAGDMAEDALAALRRVLTNLSPAQMAVLFAAIAGASGLWFLAGWLLRRRRSKPVPPPVLAYTPPGAEMAALARRFETWLRRRGADCPPQRTWREHVERVGSGALPDAARAFVDAYDAARFGQNGDPAVLARLRDLLRRAEEEGKPSVS